MRTPKHEWKSNRDLVAMVISTIVAGFLMACANIGSPEGGPRDYTPPVVTKTSPDMGAINVKDNKIEISFNELINIKDQQKKVVVSPAQHDQPLIRALGKKITVELRDTLLPETTYVIDFTNSIEDNNEGNQLDRYAFTFSTGPVLDSLQVSGIVLGAANLEPMQHVLVGLHSNLSDTAFTRLPLERITRTNDLGQFTIKGLKPGKYNIFALNDMDGDYRMARTEDIAFLGHTIEPTATSFTSQDTVFTFDHKVDTIITATHTEFKPNNVLLSMFNEHYRSLYLITASRPTPSKLHMKFGAKVDTLPQLRILSPTGFEYSDDWYRLERTAQADSLTYWLTDSTLIKADTIHVAARYQITDSTDNIVWHADTIHFAYKKPNWLIKQDKETEKEREQIAQRLADLNQRMQQGKEVDSLEVAELEKALIEPTPKLKVEFATKSAAEVYDSISFITDAPVGNINMSRIRLEMKHDSLWEDVAIQEIIPANDIDLMKFCLPMLLQPDSTYRMTINSGAITSIYGHTNDSIDATFHVRSLEDYSNLTLHVNVPDHAFVELLGTGEKLQRSAPVVGGVAKFSNVIPDTYYLRLTLDRNNNGRWDTGNYALHLQPDEVYYYPKAMKLRSNWDVEQKWNIYETALDLQKPQAIKKNRPEEKKNDLEKKNKKKNGEDEEEEDDEFNSTGFGNATYSGNKYRDYQNNRSSSRGSTRQR